MYKLKQRTDNNNTLPNSQAHVKCFDNWRYVLFIHIKPNDLFHLQHAA